MPILVAAATDQTGRTITMLSAGLVAVALGLTVLTIWYWRFTSPRRRATTAASVSADRPVAEEPASVRGALAVESPQPVEHVERPHSVEPVEPSQPVNQVEPLDPVEPSEWVELWAAGDPPDEPDQTDPPDQVASLPDTDDTPIGLDGEQWAVLAQGVLDEYLDS